MSESDHLVAMEHVAAYTKQCGPTELAPEVSTSEGSITFTVDNGKSLLFKRRAATTIDVMELSDRVEAIDLFANGLTEQIDKRFTDGNTILTKVATDSISQYSTLMVGISRT